MNRRTNDLSFLQANQKTYFQWKDGNPDTIGFQNTEIQTIKWVCSHGYIKDRLCPEPLLWQTTSCYQF